MDIESVPSVCPYEQCWHEHSYTGHSVDTGAKHSPRFTLVCRGKDGAKGENAGGADTQKGNYTKKGYFSFFENPDLNSALSFEPYYWGCYPFVYCLH